MAIVLDGSNITTTGVINSGTAVASTSGTSINFTGIPAGVKRITVMFSGVSTNGSSIPLIQLGTGGAPTTTGYVAVSTEIYNSGYGTVSTTAGFNIYWNSAGYAFSGTYTLVNVTGNTWVGSSVTSSVAATVVTTTASGSVTLGGTLNMVRVTTTNGTDTFDAGSINIFYE